MSLDKSFIVIYKLMQVEEETHLIRQQILSFSFSFCEGIVCLPSVSMQTSVTAINKALVFALVDLMRAGSNIYLHDLKESVHTFSGNSFYF